MYKFQTSFPVRYYETDRMGVVHHSNYIRYFECARSAMMVDWGYPIEKCEADGITMPVVSVECRYKYPAKMGDILTVTSTVESVPLAKLYVKQEVINQDGQICAFGSVVIGFLNKDTGRPVRCPRKIVEIIESK